MDYFEKPVVMTWGQVAVLTALSLLAGVGSGATMGYFLTVPARPLERAAPQATLSVDCYYPSRAGRLRGQQPREETKGD